MESSRKVTRFKSSFLPSTRQSKPFVGLTALVVLLPQALAFAAASGTEAKTELYTVFITGSVIIAWVITGHLKTPNSDK